MEGILKGEIVKTEAKIKKIEKNVWKRAKLIEKIRCSGPKVAEKDSKSKVIPIKKIASFFKLSVSFLLIINYHVIVNNIFVFPILMYDNF